MFGQLGILKRRLGCARPSYQAHFCASCHLMAEFAGKPAALWMNYDLTFLSVLLSSLVGAETARTKACTALPWRRVPVAPLPGWGRQALAAINLALLAAKLEDDRQDEPGLARRLAGAWVGSYQKRVEAVLSGRPLELIRELPVRQLEVEQASISLEELSRPTAEVLGGLLEHVGQLAERPERIPELGRLGSALGRYLYFLDAAQDFRQDARQGRFNALQACWGPAWQEARAASLLHRSLEDLAAALRSFADLEPLGRLIDPLLDSLADRLPVHTSWVPSWRRSQAASCDCGGCDGCCHADCCAAGHHGDCCSGCNLSDCCGRNDLDCCCQMGDCCHAGTSPAPRAESGPLRCPACLATLQARKAGPVEVDLCPFCAGLWLDKNELQALSKMRSLPSWLLDPVPSRADRDLVPEGQRFCPRCQAVLQTADSKGVMVDLCQSCQGLWLDRGELNRVLKS